MKRITISLLAVCTLVFLGAGCKPKVKPISEIIGKVWSAQTVKEGTSVVYTKGAATNIKGAYSNFKLDLSSVNAVTLTEFDNSKFTGKWAVTESASGNTLTLSDLTPIPTGTTGTIVYTINTATETELNLTRTTGSQKTGGSINQYGLVNP